MLWVNAARGYLMVSHNKCPVESTAWSYSSCLIEQNKLSPFFWASQDMEQAEGNAFSYREHRCQSLQIRELQGYGLSWTDQSQPQLEQESRQPVFPDVTVGTASLGGKDLALKINIEQFQTYRLRILCK